MNILIADDDIIALEILRNALEENGHQVTTATNGLEALETLEAKDIRFVITDWEMPELNGVDLCRAVRRSGAKGYTYVILLTSRGKSEEIVEGMSAGADDFIVKPFNAAELLVRVRAGQRILALETRDVAILALAKLAESRDSDTGKHLERVQRYSLALSQKLAKNSRFADLMDDEFIRLVYQTSPLHDMGKVGIPDSVLLKPGRLSDQEFEIMKSHAAIGAATLDAALKLHPEARFLQVARDIAAAHHERWDGTGYPRQLAGEAIPLAARIVALADVYDALTSKRVYKAAFSPMVARGIIESESGTHFDPDVVAAFLEAEEEFTAIFKSLSEDVPTQTSAPIESTVTTSAAALSLI
jgi:putative two-component system response regulator